MGEKKRKPGRPKRGEELATPEKLEEIARRYLQGESYVSIGKAVGLRWEIVRHHLEKNIRPRWREHPPAMLEEELQKLRVLEQVAWAKFKESEKPTSIQKMKEEIRPKHTVNTLEKIIGTRTGEATWLHVVEWCMEHRAKLLGLFAEAKVRIRLEDTYRVAGQSAAEMDAAMMKRLEERIEERKRLGAGRN